MDCRLAIQVTAPIGLRPRYAVSGTDTRVLLPGKLLRCQGSRPGTKCGPISLPTRYSISGTDVAYLIRACYPLSGPELYQLRSRYAKPGTDLRMVLPG
eukprot:2335759-Rhodomonas_salina.1